MARVGWELALEWTMLPLRPWPVSGITARAKGEVFVEFVGGERQSAKC